LVNISAHENLGGFIWMKWNDIQIVEVKPGSQANYGRYDYKFVKSILIMHGCFV
jgi:hypothetical protein